MRVCFCWGQPSETLETMENTMGRSLIRWEHQMKQLNNKNHLSQLNVTLRSVWFCYGSVWSIKLCIKYWDINTYNVEPRLGWHAFVSSCLKIILTKGNWLRVSLWCQVFSSCLFFSICFSWVLFKHFFLICLACFCSACFVFFIIESIRNNEITFYFVFLC